MSLAAATRSEVSKQFSTSLWWVLAIVLVAYVALMSGGLAGVLSGVASGTLPAQSEIPISGGAVPTFLYSLAASLGYVFALIIGTVMVTGEFRHKTLTPTFLAVPHRGTALLAKVLVGAFLGIVYGVLALIAAVGPAAGILAGFGQDTGLEDAGIWALFGRSLLALVLWTVMGVGIGALVRNQIGAIVGILVFTQLVEPVLRLGLSLVKDAGSAASYLPGGASEALVGAGLLSLASQSSAESPAWWIGAVVLAAYTVVFLVLGWLTSWRRDVA